MHKSAANLYGSAPDKSPVALVLIDVINDLEFPEGSDLLASALPMAEQLAALKTRATELGIPAIYVNDNFGRWRSDFKSLVRHCLEDECTGQPIVEQLQPDSNDYFVLKPKHSAFFSTTLELLLDHLGAETLILCGMATNICVLFTANDAYQRGYQIIVPADCVAANSKELSHDALEQMKAVLKADVRPWREIALETLIEKSSTQKHPAADAKAEVPHHANSS